MIVKVFKKGLILNNDCERIQKELILIIVYNCNQMDFKKYILFPKIIRSIKFSFNWLTWKSILFINLFIISQID